MAIAFNELTQGTGTEAQNQPTASVSPTAGAVVWVAFACARDAGDPEDSASITVTGLGAGATWTRVGTTLYGGRRRLFVYRATGTFEAGVITLQRSITGIQEWIWSVDETTGVDGTTQNDAAQTNANTGQASLAVGDVGTVDAGDMVYAVFATESNGDGPALESGFTVLSAITGGANVRTLTAGYAASPDAGNETPSASWTGANDAGGIGFVINAAAGGGAVSRRNPCRMSMLGVGFV